MDEAEFSGQLEGKFLLMEMLDEPVPAIESVSESMFFDDLFPDSSLGEIPSCNFPFFPVEKDVVIIFGDRLVDLEEKVPLGEFFLLAG